jgi:hypothetical protein
MACGAWLRVAFGEFICCVIVINILYVYTVYVKTVKMRGFLLLLSDLLKF